LELIKAAEYVAPGCRVPDVSVPPELVQLKELELFTGPGRGKQSLDPKVSVVVEPTAELNVERSVKGVMVPAWL
jgi:hypothetical protein